MDLFTIFYKMKVCCVFSLELPHGGNSYEYTQHTITNINRKSPEISKNTIMYAAMVFFC